MPQILFHSHFHTVLLLLLLNNHMKYDNKTAKAAMLNAKPYIFYAKKCLMLSSSFIF